MLRAVRAQAGSAMAVSDEAIGRLVLWSQRRKDCCCARKVRQPMRRISRPSVATIVKANERVVLFNCASGLKYPMPKAGIALGRPG